jgi:hypothetical protein
VALPAAVFALALGWWAQPIPYPADADGPPGGQATAVDPRLRRGRHLELTAAELTALNQD